MGASGSTFVDFGAGSDHASTNVTGQAAILGTSLCEAWLDPTRAASQATGRTEDEHEMAAGMLGVVCNALVAGTGFTITVTSNGGLMYGKFAVSWVWV
jgi:hypothetical protein